MRAKLTELEQLREATERFLGEFSHVTDAQWVTRPAPAQWSVTQVAEHVALSNWNICRMLMKRLLGSPIDDRVTDVTDAEIPYLFYRGDEPPDVAAPTGDWTKAHAAQELDASVRAIVDWTHGTNADLRSVGSSHPVFGLLDGVQWLLFAAAHTERHRAQILGLRRHWEG